MNITAMLKRNADERIALDRMMRDPFWRPVLQRWAVWIGCSWAVASVFVLAPFLFCTVRGLCVMVIKLAAR